ncbi:hypothetical protein [Deinococcus maricopensis]|uniref:Uncharacterized protein n=1 Tax=Deinococcus maricopensis (strain DSM 21211 / LMG 22137 / NRRL B-23946 / LB-34) TaxID=709986 RepID=E8U616_DEIML|nr:hypothetical protein [Deinococcus maricopensis]ADV66505.1 hypothetical protein Deima_0850 [Deinococcus maricopensis DSM 21211]
MNTAHTSTSETAAPMTKKEAARAARLQARAEKAAERLAAAQEKLEIAMVKLDRDRRVTKPEGEFDRQGRWYPSWRESSSHLNSVRAPSVKWPYSLLKATSSRHHLRALRREKPMYWRELLMLSLKYATDEQIAEYLAVNPQVTADVRVAVIALTDGPRAAALAALNPEALPPISAPAQVMTLAVAL